MLLKQKLITLRYLKLPLISRLKMYYYWISTLVLFF